MSCYIADGQIHIGRVSVFGQLHQFVKVRDIKQPLGEAQQCAATYAGTSQMGCFIDCPSFSAFTMAVPVPMLTTIALSRPLK